MKKSFDVEIEKCKSAVDCVRVARAELEKLRTMAIADRREAVASGSSVVRDALMPFYAVTPGDWADFEFSIDICGAFHPCRMAETSKIEADREKSLFDFEKECKAYHGEIVRVISETKEEAAAKAIDILPRAWGEFREAALNGTVETGYQCRAGDFIEAFRRAILQPLKDCPRPDGFSDFEISVFKEVEDRHDEGMSWKEAWAYVEDSHGGKVQGHTPAVWARRERDYRGEAGISVGGQGKKKRRRKRYK